jgi:ankyrin repeat protein
MEINLSELEPLKKDYVNNIHKSIEDNDIDMLQTLLEDCKDDEDKLKFEDLAVSYACEKNYIETIKSLLEKYKSFREKDKFEELILYHAFNGVMLSRIDIIKFLYEKDINYVCENLFNTAISGIFQDISFHKDYCYRFDEYYDSNHFCQFFDLINLLLSKNLNLKVSDANLYNIYETFEDNKYTSDTIKYLVKRNIDINDKKKNGYSLFLLACICGKLDDVKYLIENGAKIDTMCDEKYTPLMHMCMDNKIEIIKYLIKNGANIEAKDKKGWTPLMHACKLNYFFLNSDRDYRNTGTKLKDKNETFEIVKYLIKKGADVNQESLEKDRPITIAYYNENIEIVKYLLDKGAYIL